MCGIAGIFLKKSNKEIRNKLKTSLSYLRHRGPNDEGLFVDDDFKLGFSHTRLSILDLSSAGHQPMKTNNEDIFLTYNGEIYNNIELKNKFLNNSKIIWEGTSDTEVLLNLIDHFLKNKYSISALLNELNGIFSFASWNKKNSEFILARDAFGVKPLYYSNLDNGFYFASEIKALLPLILDCDKENILKDKRDIEILDLNSINRYLTYLWCPGKGTPLKFIKKVKPGEYIKINKNNEITFCQWYDIIKLSINSNDFSLKENIDKTTFFLRQAVHRQMISDVPVGAFLSGGLDSSSIVNFAREINPNIKCFTIDSSKYKEKDGIPEDLEYAKKVSEHLNVPLEVVQIDHCKFAQNFEKMIYQLDEPLADPAPLNVLWISEIASQLGIKVLLSGSGGDDLFTGYRRHFASNLENYWDWLPINLRKKLELFAGDLPVSFPFLRRFRKAFSAASLSKDERLLNYFRWIKRSDLESLFTIDFKNLINNQKTDEPMEDFLSAMPKEMNQLVKMLCLEQRFFLSDHNLLYTDKMSMAMGIETRVPFLDSELVSFARSIPIKWRQKGNIGKWILKKSMEPFLPHDVIYRPKSGFGAPIRYLLKYELKEWVFDNLSKEKLLSRGLFDPDSVHALILKNEIGEIDASYTILSLICIELWCSAYLP